MTDIRTLKIKEVGPKFVNYILSAVIIHKKDKFIFKKPSKVPRGTITFLLRDSKSDTILCTVFGEEEFISNYDEKFQLFSQIDVINANIVPVNVETFSFNPKSSSNFYFIINEGFGGFIQETSVDKTTSMQLNRAIHQPFVPLSKCLNLSQIPNLELANLLVTVGFLPETSSNNCLNLLVADISCPKGVVLTLWNRNWINRALNYWDVSKPTILHIIDCKVSYSNYYKAFVLIQNQKTMIFENPWDKVATNLRQWSDDNLGQIDKNILNGSLKENEEVNLGNITVQELYEKLEYFQDIWYSCEIFGKITKFELSNAIKVFCENCKRKLAKGLEYCLQKSCESSKTSKYLEIDVHLTDFTGTIKYAKLSRENFSSVVGLNLEEYKNILTSDLQNIEDSFILENYVANIKFKKYNSTFVSIQIINLTLETGLSRF